MIKKISIFIIVFLFPLTILSSLKGDIDSNGIVEVRDYIILRRYFIKTRELTGDELKSADVNNDGVVNPADYNTIMRILIKKDSPTDNNISVESIKLSKNKIVLEPEQSNDLLYTINPNNATNKEVTWKSSNENIVKVNNLGEITAVSTGIATITITTNDGKKVDTCQVNVHDKNNMAEVKVLNMYDTPKILESLKDDEKNKDGFEYGQVIIIKSTDNKYILIDTGMNNKEIASAIYDELKKYQKSDKVKIDYLFLTHGHNDHVGNVLNLVNNENILINKVVMKEESKNTISTNLYKKIKNKKVDILKPTSEGQKINIGDYFEVYLYNINDVYKDKVCYDGGYTISFVGKTQYADKIDGKYYYFDGSTYPNIKLISTDKIVYKHGKSYNKEKGLDNYFYANISNGNDCNANTNSLGILIKVKGEKNTYMYFTGDMNNSGYEIVPSSGIYGTLSLYSNMESIKYSKETGYFTGQMETRNIIPSETESAIRIKKMLGNEVNNISIYQSAHHGLNDNPDAINLLNLNRKEVYAIITRSFDISTSSNFLLTRTYFYTLNNATKLYPGGTTKNGISCIINNKGNTLCNYY